MTNLEKNFSRKIGLFGMLWFICLLVSCNPQQQTDASKTNQAVQIIDHAKVDAVYEEMAIAYRKADINMIGNIYADTAVYFNPGDRIQMGEKEFLPGFHQLFQEARDEVAQLSLEFEIKKRTVAGDKVIDFGYYRFIREKEGEDTNESVGKFLTILQQRADGAYEFIADVNSQAPEEAWIN